MYFLRGPEICCSTISGAEFNLLHETDLQTPEASDHLDPEAFFPLNPHLLPPGLLGFESWQQSLDGQVLQLFPEAPLSLPSELA